MSEEPNLDEMRVIFGEWRPGDKEADKEFFDTVLPTLRSIKERYLREPSESRPERSEEAVQKSLKDRTVSDFAKDQKDFLSPRRR